MGNKVKIGLSYTFNNHTNCAVVNYIYSIVKALNTLHDEMKPFLVLFINEESHIDIINEIEYPFLEFYLTTPDKDIPDNVVDFIYPYYSFEPQFKHVKNKIRWLVDFNIHYFPEHFTEKDRTHVINYEQEIINSKMRTVLSSFSVYEDLKKFYPNYENEIKILRFAVVLNNFSNVNINKVKMKYLINSPYFITPNQLWAHKNHIIILKAAKILFDKGYNFEIIFTGPRRDERTSDYYPTLINYINNNNLSNKIKFLGLIDRNEQLSLMDNAISIIQPSLLEGWSTLVEECKALNQFIIISDLKIHREQINNNCMFFDPYNPNKLAECMEIILQNEKTLVNFDYTQNIKEFALNFLNIFK